MDKLQDYQKPYFKEYLEMCQEIEKIPAHEQQTKVIVAFHEFYKKMRDDLVELQSTIEINDDFIHNKYGYCYYEIESGKNPIVFNLYVHPQYRKQGHAKKILQHVINEIRQTGYIGQIDIEVAPRENSIDRDNLASFYMSFGLHLIEHNPIEEQMEPNSQLDTAEVIEARKIATENMAPFIDEWRKRSDKALAEAVSVIYLADNSDYLPALWSIVGILGGEGMKKQLISNPLVAYKQCQLRIGNPVDDD